MRIIKKLIAIRNFARFTHSKMATGKKQHFVITETDGITN